MEMNDYEMDDVSKQTSRYNEAGFQVQRLNEYWIQAENYANRGNLSKWHFKLNTIWRELTADVERLNDTYEIPNLNKDKASSVSLTLWIKSRNTFLTKKIKLCQNKSDLYIQLSMKHEFLKWVQDKCGKGGSYSDVDEDGTE